MQPDTVDDNVNNSDCDRVATGLRGRVEEVIVFFRVPNRWEINK